MAEALLPLAMQLGKRAAQLGFNAVKQRRRRRVSKNKWVLGSRLLGYQFDPNSTPRGRRRRNRRRGRNGAMAAQGVNTTFSQPVTFGNVYRQPVAPMSKRESGNEDLDVVVSGPDGGYFCESYSINPAESDTFARLSAVASQYQRYTFNRMQLVFTPYKGTSQTGEMGMAFASDPQTPDPANMTEFMGLFGAIRGPVNLPVTFNVDPRMFSKALQQYMLKMNKTPAAEDDSVIYSVGRFFVATQDVSVTTATSLGRLAVSYDVTFYDPKIKPEANTTSNTAVFVDAQPAATPFIMNDADYVSPAVASCFGYYRDPTYWVTRSRHPVLVIARGASTGAVDPTFTLKTSIVPSGETRLPECFTVTDGVGHTTCTMWVVVPRTFFTIEADVEVNHTAFTFVPITHDLSAAEAER